MDFKEITTEQENAAKARFLEHGQGINMGKYVSYEIDQDSAKWHDLINTSKFAEQSIIQKMKNLAVKINQSCEDEMLGDTSKAFAFENEREEMILFTYEECYLFLRASLRYRRNTAEYKDKKTKIAELTELVEKNKTVTEKRRDWKTELKALQESL